MRCCRPSNSNAQGTSCASPSNCFIFFLLCIDLTRLDGEPELSVALVEAPGDVDGALPHSEPVEKVAPNVGNVDWSTLQINQIYDECEGRLEFIEDEHMFELLGLKDEEEKARKAAAAAAKCADKENVPAQNIDGASLHVDDCIPGEKVIVYDPDKPCMSLGSVYPCMKEFRLAMRQFAINEEFELDLEKTDPTRYIANCKAEDCPWHIVGRRQPDKKTVMVLTWHLTISIVFVYIISDCWQLTICFFIGHSID